MENIKSQIESWVANEAQATINSYYAAHLSSLNVPRLTIKFGVKYAQIWNGTTIWAFIALYNTPEKAEIAIIKCTEVSNDFFPILKSAKITMATTAGFNPANIAYTQGILP